jgi:hypothetical protein
LYLVAHKFINLNNFSPTSLSNKSVVNYLQVPRKWRVLVNTGWTCGFWCHKVSYSGKD